MNKTLKLIYGIFLGMGLLFMLIGGGMKIGYELSTKDYVPVEGHIVSFVRGNPVVGYTLNGYEGEIRSNTRTSWQKIGDAVTIMVDPNDPSKSQDGSLSLIGIVFLCVGGSMLAVPVVMAALEKKRQKKLMELNTYGQRVRAQVTEVKENYFVNLNHRHPWRVYAACRHPVTGEEITVHSQDLWKTHIVPGDTVEVLFDSMNDKRWIMVVEEDE